MIWHYDESERVDTSGIVLMPYRLHDRPAASQIGEQRSPFIRRSGYMVDLIYEAVPTLAKLGLAEL